MESTEKKRVKRNKKQLFIDARSAYEKKQKAADDAKTLMQLAFQAWQSELEQAKSEFDEISKSE